MDDAIFNDLFVLELANNHLGSLDRGLEIVGQFAEVVRANGVRAAIKLQFRDIGSFVHRRHRLRQDVRYIRKITATELSWGELRLLTEAIRAEGMIAMATPFDEISVDKCVEFDLSILKIASSDIRDRSLLARIAAAGRPVIASSGGARLEDLDALVAFFADRGVAFALNHCVSIYPSEDGELQLNQIDFLKARYPGLTIGFSSHEKTDWSNSMLIAYAKGARTFERHIDIDADGVEVSPYCTLPHQANAWFRAFHKAREMCGAPASVKTAPPREEVEYLDQLVRGVYARRDLPAGHVLAAEDVYFAVPLTSGQISVREFVGGEALKTPIGRDEPIHAREIDADYARDLAMRRLIDERGLATTPPAPAVPAGPRRTAAG